MSRFPNSRLLNPRMDRIEFWTNALPVVAVIGLPPVLATTKVMIANPEGFAYLLLLAMILLPPFAALWMHLRLAPLIADLTQLALREELALTFLKPAEYLAPILRPRFWSLTAPVWVGYPVLVLTLMYFTGRQNPDVFEVTIKQELCISFWAAIWTISVLRFSISGIYRIIIMRCQFRSNRMGAYAAAMMESCAAITMSAIPYLLAIIAFMLPEPIMPLVLICALMCSAFNALHAGHQVTAFSRRMMEAYFSFPN
ncbi:MAG: hypothetical protein NTX50_21830 [Candidatus Sumerlaeota bacterium]|nr:hypothetical protein [Candidatus Sumerlaeota bacterium]